MAKVMKWGETVKVLLDVGFLTDAFTLDSSTLNDLLEGRINRLAAIKLSEIDDLSPFVSLMF